MEDQEMEYDIKTVAAVTGARIFGCGDGKVSEILTDSRRLSFPENTLFFAISTDSNDGHKYIKDLYTLRVRSFVVTALPDNIDSMPEASFLLVDDSVRALQRLSAYHRQQFSLPVIGITGSNGKTVVKEFLYQLLGDSYNIVRSPRSYNSQTGVPLSVWNISKEHTLGIFEAGISEPGEMDPLEEIIRPDIGVFTNLGKAHQENFASMKDKAMEKMKLFRSCRTVVCCADDPVLSEIMPENAFVWSRTDHKADLYVESVAYDDLGASLVLRFPDTTRRYRIPFQDEASVNDSIICAAVLYCLSPSLADDPALFEKLEPVAMRMEVKQGRNNTIIINDTYNSDLNSLCIALDFQAGRRCPDSYRKILILSDIFQSGMSAGELYGDVAAIVREKGIDYVIGIGENISAYSQLFPEGSVFFPDTESFLSSGTLAGLGNAQILVKGSRRFHFEKITERLEKKVHETILEVNLDAVVHNFNTYRSRISKDTKIVCMVKAFAYGAGSHELAKTLQEHRCDYLAVAVADEGVELRKEGITIPIMVMNPELGSLGILFEYSLEPEVYSFRLLEAMEAEARKAGVKDYPIHLKVDTGMHRLGFLPEEFPELCARLAGCRSLRVASLFSHFAGSDSPDFDDFTMLQIKRYNQAASTLEASLGYKFIRHILNSAGIERFPQFQMDMVRLGIGLYGVSASGMEGLRNVSTLKTSILQIKSLQSGETVGYSRKGVLARTSEIAVIPIGYADGLDRHLGNGCGEVVVNGTRCPIVGNICMDACMVDVTGINAAEGDRVEIFGDSMPVEEVARRLGTIPYEVLTSVSPRVKRVYYRE